MSNSTKPIAMTETGTEYPHSTTRLSLQPLMFSYVACTAALMAFVVVIGPVSRILGMPGWQTGVILTIGGVSWTLSARPWGDASDRAGRRRILLLGVGGFSIGYAALCIVLAYSLSIGISGYLLFACLALARGTVGIFYAAIPSVSHALVADHFVSGERARVLALVGAANGCGLVIGPALAAALTQVNVILPIVVIAVVPFLALLMLWRSLPKRKPSTYGPVPRLALTDPRLRRPMLIAFVAMLCVYIAQVTVGFYALDRLHLAPDTASRVAGVALMMVGVALIAAQVCVRRIPCPPRRLSRIGAFVSAAGFSCVPFANSAVALEASFFIAALGMGWVFPSVSAMASVAVPSQKQGAAAGSVNAAQGLGVVVGPLVGTLLYEAGPAIPYIFASLLLLLVAGWPEADRI